MIPISLKLYISVTVTLVVRQHVSGCLHFCVRCLSVSSLFAKLRSLVVASHVTYWLVFVVVTVVVSASHFWLCLFLGAAYSKFQLHQDVSVKNIVIAG